MGLLKAAASAIGSATADQYLEYFYCDAMKDDVLAVKGKPKKTAKGSNNGTENIISNGSTIVVNQGQAMIIVDQGRVVEMTAEPGTFKYDQSSEPSFFSGSLGQNFINYIKTIGRRIAYGGETAKDQRVYYINIAPVRALPFGTSEPIPFRVVDRNIGLDVDVSLRCSGEYEIRIENPIIFFEQICRNFPEQTYPATELTKTLKVELVDALAPCFSEISDKEIRPNQLNSHRELIKNEINEYLKTMWAEARGVVMNNIMFRTMSIPQEDQDMIKELQRTAVMRNPGMAAATLVNAQAEAMQKAADNKNGAMMGFMGMNMANQAGGMNANSLFQMDQQQAQMQQQQAQMNQQQAQPQTAAGAVVAGGWDCSCGQKNNTGKFCVNCGAKKPEEQEGWTCSCGTINKGNFCQNCGSKRPAGAPLYKCDKCGWEPEDPKNPPKFCPVCGDKFDENDIVQ